MRNNRNIAIYGQESNYTTWRLAKMNLVVRGIDSNIRWNNDGSFHKNELRDLKAGFILANPPFNISDWAQLFYSTQIPACLWFLARNKNPVAVGVIVADTCCSSTHDRWVTWSIALGANFRTRTYKKFPLPTMRGAGQEPKWREGQ